MEEAYTILEKGIFAALETYSNVHRGSGLNSRVTTHLFEQARDIILELYNLNRKKYLVIFCTARRADIIKNNIEAENYFILSSQDIGLPIGIRALVVKKNHLPKDIPFETGGATTKLISKKWVIWADAPEKFEPGTPPIVNIILFARSLLMIKKYGNKIFINPDIEKQSFKEILYHDELENFQGLELLNKLKLTLIGNNVTVPTQKGIRPFINMDNSASTQTFIPIWDTYRQTLRQTAKVQQEIIQEVRSITASFLGAPLPNYDFIYTSNTTEAINIVAKSINYEIEGNIETIVLGTILEHSSNDLPWRMNSDSSLIRLTINADGYIDMIELNNILESYNQEHQYGNKRIKLVVLTGASNVLGVCNDIKEISRIVHQSGAKLLIDAAQLVAHRKVEMENLGIDYLAFSAHKVYAPFGCGMLIARKGLLKIPPKELEVIRSSGEENSAGIAAMGKALSILQKIGIDMIQEEERSLTKIALQAMSKISGITIYGIKETESPDFINKIGVIPFSLKKMMPNQVAKQLALIGGIGIRYGCHCAHILVKNILHVSPSLERFQKIMITLLPKIKFPGVARVSFGIANSREDIDRLIATLCEINKQTPDFISKNIASNPHGIDTFTKADVQKKIKEFIINSSYKVYSDY